MNPPHVAQAVAALTSKAQRLRASAASQPRGVARERELADFLKRAELLVAPGTNDAGRVLGHPVGQGIA